MRLEQLDKAAIIQVSLVIMTATDAMIPPFIVPASSKYLVLPDRPGALFTAVDWGKRVTFRRPAIMTATAKPISSSSVRKVLTARFYKRLSGGTFSNELFGLASDLVVPGDYDGDGKTDLCTVRNNAGFLDWHFEPSGTPGSTDVVDTWGITGDLTVQGDYDGDGKTDYAVWSRARRPRFI